MTEETMAPLMGAECAALVARARLCAEELAQMSRDSVRVSAERRAAIRRLFELGMSREDVASALGVTPQRVSHLLHSGGVMQDGPGP